MKHLVTRHEAVLVRTIASGVSVVGLPPRIWRPPGTEPIGLVEASGRAACRECGETIEKGEQAIAFGFDPYAAALEPTTTSAWGKLARAYLHAAPCRVYPEEGTE